MRNILVAGGSGLIGSELTKLLQSKGFAVAWLSRSTKTSGHVKKFNWDVDAGTIDPESVKWADAIIHLAGTGIADKRWTAKRKKEITQSRTMSSKILADAVRDFPNSIKTIIASSAIGYYGNRGAEKLEESSEKGSGFLAESSSAWETATAKIPLPHMRFVTLRTGIVLSEKGGAFSELIKTMPFGIAPVLGGGKQYYAWIHMRDICGMYLFALENEQVNGVFNAVAPNTITQKELLKQARKIAYQKALLLPVPEFVLRLMLGEMADVVLLSQNVSGKKIMDAGYKFEFSEIEPAIKNLLPTK